MALRRYLHLCFIEGFVPVGFIGAPDVSALAMVEALVVAVSGRNGSTTILLLVLIAAVLHATWNFMAKLIDDQTLGFWLINASVAFFGVSLVAFVGVPSRFPWTLLALSACIHIAYNVFLLNSYRYGDLSKVYPIARGMAPPLVTIGATVITGESLPLLQLIGIAVVALAVMSLSNIGKNKQVADRSSFMFALLTGVMIASYSLVDGIASRRGEDPLSYVGLLMAVEGTLVTIVLSPKCRRIWRKKISTRKLLLGFGAGGVSVVAYAIVVWAQNRAPLAEVSALRETSVIFASIFGAVVLREGSIAKRLITGLAVFLGVVLLLM